MRAAPRTRVLSDCETMSAAVGEVSEKAPASALRRHPIAAFFPDRDAESALRSSASEGEPA